jgi:hypothetical protein
MRNGQANGLRHIVFVFLCLSLAGCSSSPEPAAPPAVPAAPAPVADHTSLFPDKGKVSASVVPDHILDMKALPGGSLAEYEVKGQKYQMFIVDADSAQKAAFMMLDIKDQLKKDPEYIAYMGGYFGMYGDKPVYCFAKMHYLAGIVGLPKDKADPLAIGLAAQLH